MEKKNLLKLIIRVFLILILFEAFIQTIGSIFASTIWKTINYGKYTKYFISEAVVLICSLVVLTVRKKWYIFKNKKLSFIETLKRCLPIVILSLLLFITNIIGLIGEELNYFNLISLIFYTISIGLFEEIFFRGIIEEELLASYSENKKQIITSIVISGIIFGSIHLTNLFYGQDFLTTITQFIQTTSIGILFGTLYYLTRNIWALAFLHGFYDFSVLLNEVNLVTECGYIDNVSSIITASSIVASIILSIIYLVYSIIIFKKENHEETKKYNNLIYLMIIIYFISNAIFSMISPDIDKYYICPEYEEKTIKKIETHYYSYDDFYYNNLHIYKDKEKVRIKNELENIDIVLDVENVERVVVIDNNLIIITYENTKYKLYYNNLDDLNNINNFFSFDIPSPISVGYLLDYDANIKYPMIKSYINDLFIIENNKLYKVKEAS